MLAVAVAALALAALAVSVATAFAAKAIQRSDEAASARVEAARSDGAVTAAVARMRAAEAARDRAVRRADTLDEELHYRDANPHMSRPDRAARNRVLQALRDADPADEHPGGRAGAVPPAPEAKPAG